MQNLKKLVDGDVVTLGNYFQNSSTNKEPLEWIIIDIEDNRALVLSSRVLHRLHYLKNPPQTLGDKIFFTKDYVWSDSAVRKWLNYNFYETAFNDEEKKVILPTDVFTYSQYRSEKHSYFTEQKSTIDKLFILARDEFKACVSQNEYNTAKPTKILLPEIATNKDGNCIWHLRTTFNRKNLFLVSQRGKLKEKTTKELICQVLLFFLSTEFLVFMICLRNNSKTNSPNFALENGLLIAMVITFCILIYCKLESLKNENKKVNISPAMWIDLDLLNSLNTIKK